MLPRVGVWLYYTATVAVVKGVFLFLLFFCCFFVEFCGVLLYFGGARLRGWFPGFGFLVLRAGCFFLVPGALFFGVGGCVVSGVGV